jgi:hypothetical protein
MPKPPDNRDQNFFHKLIPTWMRIVVLNLFCGPFDFLRRRCKRKKVGEICALPISPSINVSEKLCQNEIASTQTGNGKYTLRTKNSWVHRLNQQKPIGRKHRNELARAIVKPIVIETKPLMNHVRRGLEFLRHGGLNQINIICSAALNSEGEHCSTAATDKVPFFARTAQPERFV